MDSKAIAFEQFKQEHEKPMTDQDLAILYKTTFLPHGLGSGQECVVRALQNMTEIESFNDPAHTWIILFLLSNGFEHILKSIYEYVHPLEIEYDHDHLTNGQPRMRIKNHSQTIHALKNQNDDLQGIFKNTDLKFQITDEEAEFLILLEAFQHPKYRYQNINTNQRDEITLEQLLKQFVSKFNDRQVDDKVIYDTLERNIYSLMAKYIKITPQELNYNNDSLTPGMDLVEHIKRVEKYPLERTKPFNSRYVCRTRMTIQDDVEIGKKLFEQGLIGINNMPDLFVTSQAWVNALLIANGLERVLKPVILSKHKVDGKTYQAINVIFKDILKHNLWQHHSLIRSGVETPLSDYDWLTADKFIKFLNLTIDDEYRYENKDYHKVTPDIEERLTEFVVRDLFANHFDQDLLMGAPSLTAYQLQLMIIKLLEFYDLNSMNLDLDFKAPLDEPTISKSRIRK